MFKIPKGVTKNSLGWFYRLVFIFRDLRHFAVSGCEADEHADRQKTASQSWKQFIVNGFIARNFCMWKTERPTSILRGHIKRQLNYSNVLMWSTSLFRDFRENLTWSGVISQWMRSVFSKYLTLKAYVGSIASRLPVLNISNSFWRL